MKKKSFWQRPIPTLLGLLLLIVAIGISTYIVSNGTTTFFGRAAPGSEPQNIRITNIKNDSFTVTFTTIEKNPASVLYGKTQDETIPAFDDRDQQVGSPKEYTTHHITLKNLDPNTKYFFSIISGEGTYQNSEAPFTATTATDLADEPGELDPLTGTVALSNSTEASEIIVYGSTADSQIVSTLSKPDGTFSLSLQTIRTKDLTEYISFDETTVLTLLFRSEIAESEAKLFVNLTNPVPEITLTKNYDFTTEEQPLITDNPQATQSANTGNFPLDSLTLTEQKKKQQSTQVPSIVTPNTNEQFSDQQPRFTGKAVPNEIVQVTIQSDPITANVKADANGNWTYRPSKPLPPGNHTITIITKDRLGLQKRITQSFTVFAQGSQFTEPSVSPGTTSPTPTRTPTPPPTGGPTKTPTPTINPSASVTPTPTTLPSPTTATPTPIQSGPTGLTPRASQPPIVITKPPTPVPSVKPTGSSSATVSGIIAAGITIIGLILFFVSRGGVL